MSSHLPDITRRRWLQTAGLWGLATAVTAKGFTSLTYRERQQLSRRLAAAGESLGEFQENFTTELNEALASSPREQQSPTTAPQPEPPEPQELYPELYQGDYAQFLDNFSFRYIHTHEIITPHRRTRNGITNGLPPERLWHHLPNTLRVADEVRHRLGSPLSYITSAYRTSAYNRECGGASRSLHKQNKALDLVYEAGSQAAFEVALQLRSEGFFRGGVGFYAGFIHLDTRGSNATWSA